MATFLCGSKLLRPCTCRCSPPSSSKALLAAPLTPSFPPPPSASGGSESRSAVRWSSSSSSRWKQRQGQDPYAREAKVQRLKSRAAFKLLEVALDRTRPHGKIIGIDLIPAQPPRGVATFQGDFLSPTVQKLVREYIARTVITATAITTTTTTQQQDADQDPDQSILQPQPSYIDRERLAHREPLPATATAPPPPPSAAQSTNDNACSWDVTGIVLSDMSEPWDQTAGFTSNTLTNPYHRLMNTSGAAFRDHAGSMELCMAALQFASDTLRPGGHFVCKFYQGLDDKKLEAKLKAMFGRVARDKPESSRSESKEAYFVALRRKEGCVLESDTL
ncbi:FtsJ-like methyltransferase [Moelleriella libera RCEF 2490]|uniref:rRNA methyltransferase 2, mitochondrial n=1 Tax=Moelleriella libera RCEF 2490 TaxID=1081109 RepID=A0A168ATB6_9HYPO|nr:FtsJ-like methyltransferase [Moelleriella libera RCEF 2490]